MTPTSRPKPPSNVVLPAAVEVHLDRRAVVQRRGDVRVPVAEVEARLVGEVDPALDRRLIVGLRETAEAIVAADRQVAGNGELRLGLRRRCLASASSGVEQAAATAAATSAFFMMIFLSMSRGWSDARAELRNLRATCCTARNAALRCRKPRPAPSRASSGCDHAPSRGVAPLGAAEPGTPHSPQRCAARLEFRSPRSPLRVCRHLPHGQDFLPR